MQIKVLSFNIKTLNTSKLNKSNLAHNDRFKKIETFFIEAEIFLDKGDARSFFSHIRKSKNQLN